MRRNFAQILKSAQVNIEKEYERLYSLFYDTEYDGGSVYGCIASNFAGHPLRGTCLDIEDFDDQFGFCFDQYPTEFSIDSYLSFAEYVYNLVTYFDDRFFLSPHSKSFLLGQINKVIEAIGYMQAHDDGITIFVPKDNAAIAVAESPSLPEYLSYKVISYNHYSMQGELQKKKELLAALAEVLEPLGGQLSQIASGLKTDLFYAFNNLNIRHNNVAPLPNKKYKRVVAEMEADELERWYDDVYQMCLLAFLRLEHVDRQKRFDALKKQIEEG